MIGPVPSRFVPMRHRQYPTREDSAIATSAQAIRVALGDPAERPVME
jgi:hypothetical protein